MTTGEETPRTFGDRYVLGDRLTAGETREVWRAHDDVVSRSVALKIFFGAEAADPAWQGAFGHGADRLVGLSHPGIAKVYDRGVSSTETWLAMAFITGTPLSARLDSGQPLPAATALDLIGQTGIALAAAHDAGIVHGRIAPDAVLVRDGNVAALVGFAVVSTATAADDLAALGELAATCLGTAVSTPEQASDVDDFVDWVTNPSRQKPPSGPAELGRTALALAATLTGDHAAAAPADPEPDPDAKPAKWRREESPEEAAQRKEVRNRLIVLGIIVVVGGAALLRFIGEGGGEVTVPAVTNLQIDQAKLKLTTAGLRPDENCVVGKDSGNTVVSQSPTAGHRVKAGSSVVLTVTAAACS